MNEPKAIRNNALLRQANALESLLPAYLRFNNRLKQSSGLERTEQLDPYGDYFDYDGEDLDDEGP